MSNVTVMIGSRAFTLACADGEEEHVTRLGAMIDAKVAESGMVGQTEPRMLLFAALLLADELHELKSGNPKLPDFPPDLGKRLGKIAQRIENLADLLEAEPLDS